MASNSVEISEMDDVRSMYIDTNTIQSSMKVKAPYDLVLAYSRGMIGCLLFKDNIQETLMIGLGGGSVAKYIWKFCPDIKQTVVEINPQVINISRTLFDVPDDDARFTVIEGDGIAYLKDLVKAAPDALPEVLMIDAFDGVGIPPDFCTQRFFDDCAAALKHEGIFVINLWGSDKKFDIYWSRIANSFNDQVLKLPTGKPGNIIVFGFKGAHQPLTLAKLMARAKDLESHNQIDFLKYVETLFDRNPHTNKQLLT